MEYCLMPEKECWLQGKTQWEIIKKNIFWFLSGQTEQHENDSMHVTKFMPLTLCAVFEACRFAMHSVISAVDHDNGQVLVQCFKEL